jgi:hypothetical protein
MRHIVSRMTHGVGRLLRSDLFWLCVWSPLAAYFTIVCSPLIAAIVRSLNVITLQELQSLNAASWVLIAGALAIAAVTSWLVLMTAVFWKRVIDRAARELDQVMSTSVRGGESQTPGR